MDLKEIALKYFAEHPKAKKVVIQKAKEREAYENFCKNPTKDWLPKEKLPFIQETLLKEEKLYFSTLQKGKNVLKKLGLEASPTLLDPPYILEKYPQLTGEMLCKLHHTYGLDPLAVADLLNILDLPNKLHDDYQIAYEKHKQTGLAGFKPKEIKIEGLEEKVS